MKGQSFTAIILAGGKGTRMRSPLPKVLHPVAGQPMLRRVVEAVQGAGAKEVRIVVGYGEDLVRELVTPLGASTFRQKEQLGTADAVRSAAIGDIEGQVLVINGDHPLVTKEDIAKAYEQHIASRARISVVSCELKQPSSFGRIKRDGDRLLGIVEASDASPEELKIREVNTGVYFLDAESLQTYLPQIKSGNTKGEYYFTDIISLAQDAGDLVAVVPAHRRVAFGVNSQRELSKATQYLFHKKAIELSDEGVIVIDPRRTYIEDSVKVGSASLIYPGCVLQGESVIGQYCVLESNVILRDSQLSNNVHVKAGSYIDSSVVGSQVAIGPYAHLRPGSELKDSVRIGNFVELKKTTMGKGSKANHLTYLGDAEIGEDTNIGCGTITCNYAVDKRKYKTKIGDKVFVGSDVQFVAPVDIGDESVIASGSTITKDVPSGALGVARGKQYIKENYKPKKSEEPAKLEK